jgi:hypothetical protein
MRGFRWDRRVVSVAVSIHRVMRKSGERFLVRHRDPEDVNRSRAFATELEAERFQRQLERARAPRRASELQPDLKRF